MSRITLESKGNDKIEIIKLHQNVRSKKKSYLEVAED